MEPEDSLPSSLKCLTPYPESDQFSSYRPILRFILTIFTNLRLGFSSSLFHSGFSTNMLHSLLFSPFVLYALLISSSTEHSNYTRRGVQITKLFITQYSRTPCHYTNRRFKYPPQHPFLTHPHSMFLPECRRPNFTYIQKHRQKYCLVYANF
jgi:hypothetical protein